MTARANLKDRGFCFVDVGTSGGNWGWRFTQAMLSPGLASRLEELTETSGRAPRLRGPETDSAQLQA